MLRLHQRHARSLRSLDSVVTPVPPEAFGPLLELFSSVVWALAACVCVFRFSDAIETFSPSGVDPEEDPLEAEIPQDLLAFATSLKDEWAIEDTIKVMRERYADLRDWNRVRAAMGIGSLPENT